MSMSGWVQRFLAYPLAFFLPPSCVACHGLLPATEPIGVCPDCWPKLPFWRQDLISMPLLDAAIDAYYAPFVYEEPVSQWIKALKFYDRTELTAVLAQFMVSAYPQHHAQDAGLPPLVVPVPLHRRRLRQRLYNQSALLARRVARHNGGVYAPLAMQRVKHTLPQSRKTRRQREQLTAKTFAVRQNVLGRRVILVDDILTTGTTATACAQALKQAGACRVEVLTAAYVPP